jgi:hypothetical protein
LPLPEKMDRAKAVEEAHKLLEEAAVLLTELVLRVPQARYSTEEKVVRALSTVEEVEAVATTEVVVAVQTPTALEMMQEQVEVDLHSQIRSTHQTLRISRVSKVAMEW